jgi:hypothetical protein
VRVRIGLLSAEQESSSYLRETMKIDKNLRTGIIGGLIVFVLITVLKPLTMLCFKFFYLVVSRFHASTLDHFYKAAAIGKTADYGMRTYYFIVFLLLSAAVTSLILMRHLGKEKGESAPTRQQKVRKRAKIMTVVTIVYFTIYVIFLSYGYWGDYFVSKACTSFSQHLAVLAPYMTDMERKELESQWALMKNRADHEVIVKKLTDLATSKGITLPKNPVY